MFTDSNTITGNFKRHIAERIVHALKMPELFRDINPTTNLLLEIPKRLWRDEADNALFTAFANLNRASFDYRAPTINCFNEAAKTNLNIDCICCNDISFPRYWNFGYQSVNFNYEVDEIVPIQEQTKKRQIKTTGYIVKKVERTYTCTRDDSITNLVNIIRTHVNNMSVHMIAHLKFLENTQNQNFNLIKSAVDAFALSSGGPTFVNLLNACITSYIRDISNTLLKERSATQKLYAEFVTNFDTIRNSCE